MTKNTNKNYKKEETMWFVNYIVEQVIFREHSKLLDIFISEDINSHFCFSKEPDWHLEDTLSPANIKKPHYRSSAKGLNCNVSLCYWKLFVSLNQIFTVKFHVADEFFQKAAGVNARSDMFLSWNKVLIFPEFIANYS